MDLAFRDVRLHDVELWFQLSLLANQVSQSLERRLSRRHGFGLTDFMVLSTIGRQPSGPLRMQDLADETGFNQSTLSRVANRLEHNGLVLRHTNAHDRRGVLISLTAAGQQSLSQAMATFQDELAVALETAALSPRTAELTNRIRRSSPP